VYVLTLLSTIANAESNPRGQGHLDFNSGALRDSLGQKEVQATRTHIMGYGVSFALFETFRSSDNVRQLEIKSFCATMLPKWQGDSSRPTVAIAQL
jgi:hypothetical protein